MNRQGVTRLPELVSLDDAATALSLSIWTIRSWVRRGRIKSVKLGTRRLIEVSEVHRFVSEGKATAASQSR